MSLILGIFALAGVPPSIGFTGKLLLFTSAMNSGYFWLVLIGAVNGTMSLYYYLKVVYAAYFTDDPALPAISLACPSACSIMPWRPSLSASASSRTASSN